MSTDLVVRLRLDGGELCLEAAREIAHLRECLTLAVEALETIKATLQDEKA